jgi:hypothetical protein
LRDSSGRGLRIAGLNCGRGQPPGRDRPGTRERLIATNSRPHLNHQAAPQPEFQMKFSQAWVGALCLAAACSSTAGEPDLETMIARHVAARGGAAAIESVGTFECDLHIVEPSFEVDGTYVATRDGRMRIDISAGGERVFTEALDRGRAWSWSANSGVSEGSAAGAAALRHGIEFPFKLFGLHEMRVRGHHLEAAGRETVEGIDYHVLKMKLDDGFEVRYYLHPYTWLIERERTKRALHVDVDPIPEWIETVYGDYRPVGGVLFSHWQVERQLGSGSVLSTGTIREIRINPPLAPERFSPP